jgi:hypothetical protein
MGIPLTSTEDRRREGNATCKSLRNIWKNKEKRKKNNVSPFVSIKMSPEFGVPKIISGYITIYFFFLFWILRLLALRPLLAYCASLG